MLGMNLIGFEEKGKEIKDQISKMKRIRI